MTKKVDAPTPPAAQAKAMPKPVVKKVKPTSVSKPKAKQAPLPASKPVVKAASKPAVDKAIKPKKQKQVRDSFTIPKAEYVVLNELKERAAALTHSVKKSELLRAGIKALAAMPDGTFLSAMKAVPAIKTGRPKK